MGPAQATLDLEDPGFESVDTGRLVAMANEAEQAARSSDVRIVNSDGSGCHARRGLFRLATTEGFDAMRSSTSFGYRASVVAESGGEKQRGHWSSSARHLSDLEQAKNTGAIAAARALRGFGWSGMPSGNWPVVFDPWAASDFLDLLCGAFSGEAAFRGRTWLAKSLLRTVASPLLTIIDDPLVPRGPGSRVFDTEGVRSRKLAVVEAGELRAWLVDGYTARRLGHPYTGHSGGRSNLRVMPGQATEAELLQAAGDGLLVTDLDGRGVDVTAGRMSVGVRGFRIEGGRPGHPVQETTIAGDLRTLLADIQGIGDTPLPDHAISSPALLFGGFSVGGKKR